MSYLDISEYLKIILIVYITYQLKVCVCVP